MKDKLIQTSHKEFLKSLLSGDHRMCSELANKLLNNNVTVKELYENVITKALYDVGELWEFNKISVATEHLASAIVEAVLNELYFKIISKGKNNKTVIVSCVENEFHQIGIKMIADVFEMNGWNTLFLGANTPTQELINFAKITKPDIIAISLSIYFHLPVLENMIQMIRTEFPDLTILVGGQAFRYGGLNIFYKYDNVVYQPDLNSTDLFIKNLIA
jgi:methanogenic corrinoid protein MtbC1